MFPFTPGRQLWGNSVMFEGYTVDLKPVGELLAGVAIFIVLGGFIYPLFNKNHKACKPTKENYDKLGDQYKKRFPGRYSK